MIGQNTGAVSGSGVETSARETAFHETSDQETPPATTGAAAQGRFWLHGAAILALLALLFSTVFWMRLPLPEDAIRITAVQVSLDGGAFETVDLPHRWPVMGPEGNRVATYRAVVPRTPGEAALLLIPGVRHELALKVDGQDAQFTVRGAVNQDSLGATHVLRLQPATGDRTEIELRLERVTGYAPGYLSVLHLASVPAFERVGWAWRLAQSDFHLATQVLHGMVLMAVCLMWFWRRDDPVFGWMSLLAGASFVTDHLLSFLSAIELRLFAVTGFGLIAFAFALALIGVSRPRWLKLAIPLVPVLLMAGVKAGVLPPMLAFAFSGVLAIVLCLLGTLLLLRHALSHAEWDRAAMAGFFFSTVWFGLHDFGVALGRIEGAWFLSQHMRTFGLLVVLFLLMRWLAGSLNAVDQANATLRTKLDDQRRELNLLHGKEQGRIRDDARQDERQRLMRDLHDGLSGHLVSIIAQSETGSCDAGLIENTARAALDDLRLVINALDLEDDDLRLALSSLRERAEPQMSRLGIRLDWSMAHLPDVRGIKPGNSLAILRILQEALTNAIKHGVGDRVEVTAGPCEADRVRVSVTNRSATSPTQGRGYGMRNMQQRASELGGEIRFRNSSGLAQLSLMFPRDLDASSSKAER